MARDSRMKRYTAKPSDDAPEGTPDSEIYARTSEGDESVRTLDGERALSKGDVVVERSDSPGTFDVLGADAWKELGWSGSDNAEGSRKSSGTSRNTGKGGASRSTAKQSSSARGR